MTAVSVQDRDGAVPLIHAAHDRRPPIAKILVDDAYTGEASTSAEHRSPGTKRHPRLLGGFVGGIWLRDRKEIRTYSSEVLAKLAFEPGPLEKVLELPVIGIYRRNNRPVSSWLSRSFGNFADIY